MHTFGGYASPEFHSIRDAAVPVAVPAVATTARGGHALQHPPSCGSGLLSLPQLPAVAARPVRARSLSLLAHVPHWLGKTST